MTVSAWATSPDRAISVLAAPGGVPLQVHLSGAALRLRPDALATAVLETATTAGRRATAELHRQLRGTAGEEAAHTLARVGLPAPPPEAEDGDDEDGFGGVLRSPR